MNLYLQRKIKTLEKKHFSLADLNNFLLLAIPSVISTGIDAVLGFIDRLFLSHYKTGAGEAYLNAGLVGGITSFVVMSFFIVTAGYSNALVAQFLGAKKHKTCVEVVSQSVFFSFFAYPLILLASMYAKSFYSLFDHSSLQLDLETRYTHIILLGAIFSILRSGIGGFFIGIHKTKVVMFANVLAAVVNIPLNYVLIYGIWFFPELGIVGAALATVISGMIALGILLGVYFGKKIQAVFHSRRKMLFNKKLFKKLLHFGLPSGVETFFGVMVFDFFIIMMSSYGETVGSAVTIAINWDAMFFIPMLGAGFTTTALVGNAMGAKDLLAAKKAAKISSFVMLSYAVFVMCVLIFFASPLVDMFLAKMKNAEEVRPLAIAMLRFACIYLFFDALHISMSSVLRGAGDTKAPMVIFLSIAGVFAIVSFAFVFTQIVSPLVAWFLFVGYAVALGAGMAVRFLGGAWKHIVVVED